MIRLDWIRDGFAAIGRMSPEQVADFKARAHELAAEFAAAEVAARPDMRRLRRRFTSEHEPEYKPWLGAGLGKTCHSYPPPRIPVPAVVKAALDGFSPD